MASYIALIRKRRGTSYGVEFPDFPGCISGGRTLDEAVQSAHEALALHVRGMLEDGAAIPAPSTLDAVLVDKHARGAIPTLVRIAAARARAVRLNVTFDQTLLERIDEAAAARGLTRSGFLAEAARAALREDAA